MPDTALKAVAATRNVLAIAAALALAGACAPMERDVVVQPAPGAVVLSDADVATTVSVANTGEIQESQIALQTSRDPAVRQFAQRMITEHTHLDQRLRALMPELRGQGGPNPITQQLTTNTQQTQQVLRDLEGNQFDRVYMDRQVQLHQWLLETLDRTLIPSARDNELERTLRQARQTVASHLQEARQLHGRVGG